MSFSGSEVTEKGLARGWDPEAQDQASQREVRNLQILEAVIFRPWAWRPHASSGLRYAYYGGYLDTGADWEFFSNGSVALTDDMVNYVERTVTGTVSVNTSGFTYGLVPMAVIETAGGRILPRTYIDARPAVGTFGGGGGGGGGGAVSFSDLIGQALDSQITASSVLQHVQPNLNLNIINEFTPDAGVTIEGVLIKDGSIETAKKATQLDEVGGVPLVSYLGKADPGSLTSAAVWAIQRIQEFDDGDIVITWADGDSNEDNVWDDRLGLAYS